MIKRKEKRFNLTCSWYSKDLVLFDSFWQVMSFIYDLILLAQSTE